MGEGNIFFETQMSPAAEMALGETTRDVKNSEDRWFDWNRAKFPLRDRLFQALTHELKSAPEQLVYGFRDECRS